MVKSLLAMQETQDQSLGQKDSLEKGMPTHSSFLAWRIPWPEGPGRLQSMGSKKNQTQLSDCHFHHILFICLSVDGHWGCLHSGTIMNNNIINICIQTFFLYELLF